MCIRYYGLWICKLYVKIKEKIRKNEVKYDYKVFGINMDRQVLYDRINQRVDIMLKQGLIEEVQSILEKYNKFPTAMQGLRL